MSEETKTEPEATPGAGEPQTKRGPVKLVGGVVGLVAAGGLLAVIAVPTKTTQPRLEGPFFAQLTEEPVPVSTIDSDNRRYVKFAVDAEYKAYHEEYVTERWQDPFFAPTLRSRIEFAASDKTIKEISEGMNREVFAEQLRVELDEVVFPLHIGETKNPVDKDPITGLRPGISRSESTFRGAFHDHVLAFDGSARTLRIDGGPEVSFTGIEEDLRIDTAQGEILYIDVTHYVPDFAGEVHVGVHGRLRRVILHHTIAQ